MSEVFGKNHTKKESLKKLIKELHQGKSAEQAKAEFKELIADATSTDIARIEEELIKEGMPQEEIHKLCDVHIALFRESLDKEKVIAPAGHPIHILMEEHKILLKLTQDLTCLAEAYSEEGFAKIKAIEESIKTSESHYVREENVLFPYLEKHGITQPPAMMWTEHDKIREIEKLIYDLVDHNQKSKDFTEKLKKASVTLAEMLANHFYKENNILFPTALQVISEIEWKDIRKEFDDLGYCPFTPESATAIQTEGLSSVVTEVKPLGMIDFETGSFIKEELEMLLNSLPVDITFVDKEDKVRYFSMTKERIFPRTKAVIGRKVQQCHPQKSVHVVNQILEDFKKGKRDVAEFWINMDKKLIYIRYFPVRSRRGEYLGCVEVTQDIAEIQKIKGEKRLL